MVTNNALGAARNGWQLWVPRLGLAACIYLLLRGVQQLLPQFFNDYVNDVVILAGINIILAVSLNLINGITGQFSLGHAGFMAAGAYSAACFTYYAGPRLALPGVVIFGLAIAVAAAAAGLAGLVVGLPSLRLRGDYLAIVTLGFGQIIIAIVITIKEVGEARGFSGLAGYTSFTWVYCLVIATILMSRNLADSTLGRSMRAVREDEVAAEACGVNTTRVKVLVFVLSSMAAGVAGALHAHHTRGAYPDTFNFQRSVDVVVMVVLGGLGSITGATLAAVILKVLEEVLRTVQGALWVSLGLVVFAAVLSFGRYRARIAEHNLALLQWLLWPALSFAGIILTYHYAWNYLQDNVSAVRYIIYALMLIVLMLLRPQGLLGRNELSWAWLGAWRKGSVPLAEPGPVASGGQEPADEGVAGTL